MTSRNSPVVKSYNTVGSSVINVSDSVGDNCRIRTLKNDAKFACNPAFIEKYIADMSATFGIYTIHMLPHENAIGYRRCKFDEVICFIESKYNSLAICFELRFTKMDFSSMDESTSFFTYDLDDDRCGKFIATFGKDMLKIYPYTEADIHQDCCHSRFAMDQFIEIADIVKIQQLVKKMLDNMKISDYRI
jgi:hypothetical protein